MSQKAEAIPRPRERLVAAAVELFSKKWYGTVSVAEICRAAGLSNGVFYRYFDGKEGLFKVILGRVRTRCGRRWSGPRARPRGSGCATTPR